MTIKELIKLEEEKIQKRSNETVNAAFVPHFPLTIQLRMQNQNVYDEAEAILRRGLSRYWGEQFAGDVDIHLVSSDDLKTAESFDDLMDNRISSLLTMNRTFQKLTTVLFFDIVQASAFPAFDDFKNHYKTCSKYKFDDGHAVNRVLFLLLDKHPTDRAALKLAEQIEKYALKETGYSSVVFLSNQLDNGGVLAPDDLQRFNVIATLIALTNKETAPNFFYDLFSTSDNRFTVGYVYKEKPVHMVTVYTLDALIRCINNRFSEQTASSVSSEQLKKVFANPEFELGVRYFQQNDYPKADCMQYFPYRDVTLGTICNQDALWKIFFENNFRATALKKAESSYETVREEFLKQLLANFTHQQLHFLLNNKGVLDQFWSTIRYEIRSAPAFSYEAAIEETKRIYSNALVEQLKESIRSILELAQNMTNELSNLQREMQQITFPISNFDVLTDSIKDYYDKEVVAPYVEKHWQDIRLEFSMQENGEEVDVMSILQEHMDNIINENSIYSSSFEGELQVRLGNDAMRNDRASVEITNFIMGDNSRVRYIPHVCIKEEAREIYLLPDNATYASIVEEKRAETDYILPIPTDQYVERISLFYVHE